MATKEGFQLSDLQPVASLALQGFTAFMVYQMMTTRRKETSSEAGSDDIQKSRSSPTSTTLTVSASQERSIRGTNVYGPYKKVRGQVVMMWRDTFSFIQLFLTHVSSYFNILRIP